MFEILATAFFGAYPGFKYSVNYSVSFQLAVKGELLLTFLSVCVYMWQSLMLGAEKCCLHTGQIAGTCSAYDVHLVPLGCHSTTCTLCIHVIMDLQIHNFVLCCVCLY